MKGEIKIQIELVGSVWSTRTASEGEKKKKKWTWEMKSAPSQDRSFSRSINPVSINPQQTASSPRAPQEWRGMTNIDQGIRSDVCSKACNVSLFFFSSSGQIWINVKTCLMFQRQDYIYWLWQRKDVIVNVWSNSTGASSHRTLTLDEAQLKTAAMWMKCCTTLLVLDRLHQMHDDRQAKTLT